MTTTDPIQNGTRVAYRAGYVALCVTREDHTKAFAMTGTVIAIKPHRVTGELIATVKWDNHNKPESVLLDSVKPIN